MAQSDNRPNSKMMSVSWMRLCPCIFSRKVPFIIHTVAVIVICHIPQTIMSSIFSDLLWHYALVPKQGIHLPEMCHIQVTFNELTTFKSQKIMIFSFQRKTNDSSVMWQMKQTAESFSNQLFLLSHMWGTGHQMEMDHHSPVLQKHTLHSTWPWASVTLLFLNCWTIAAY